MNKKNDILYSVINQFKEKGITANLTISKIADDINIGKSTIYEYFSSKDELIKDAIFTIIDSSIENMLDIENFDELDFDDAFIAQTLRLVKIAKESKSGYELYTRDFVKKLSKSIRDDLKTKLEEVQKAFENRFMLIFSKGIEEGKIIRKEDYLDGIMSAGLIVGSIMRYSKTSHPISEIDFSNKLLETIILLNN